MSTWIKQMGFPVVSASLKQEGDSRILHLKQSKFTADGSDALEQYFWMIPITISVSSKPDEIAHQFIMDKVETDIPLPELKENEWVKINPGTVGYYRTKYTPAMLEKFIPAIKDLSLPPLDRLGLLDDLFAMVQAGLTPTVEVCF